METQVDSGTKSVSRAHQMWLHEGQSPYRSMWIASSEGDMHHIVHIYLYEFLRMHNVSTVIYIIS